MGRFPRLPKHVQVPGSVRGAGRTEHDAGLAVTQSGGETEPANDYHKTIQKCCNKLPWADYKT